MTLQIAALTFDTSDAEGLARFWSGVLGWELAPGPDDGFTLLPDADAGFPLWFFPSLEPKRGPNQMHFDLTSTSLDDQATTVARALAGGGRRIDVGQGPDADHVVLADPDGNEFCVIEPGNGFLAGCGLLGCLSSDGTPTVGRFWSEVLGWPLVWDQDEETAIQAPRGGPKISWGGPPYQPKLGKNRLHLELAPPVDGDQRAEVERVLALGASYVDLGQGDVPWVVLADPDGNEFCILTPRSRE